jgi:hypothetical protein
MTMPFVAGRLGRLTGCGDVVVGIRTSIVKEMRRVVPRYRDIKLSFDELEVDRPSLGT